MSRYRWIRWIVFVSLIAFLAVGCSNNASQPIDPPPTDAETIADMIEQTMGNVETGQEVSLYYKDHNDYVVPISMKIPQVEGIAKLSLQYMTVNGVPAEELPLGFTSIIPEGTQVLAMDITSEKLAKVDFSKEFTNYDAKDERNLLEAVTWALTDFSSIDKVEIWVEGKVLKQMPKQGTPLDEPLTRSMGINIERAEVVNLGQSTPVVLYFKNQTVDDQSYFVPVTRLIERTDDIARAAVEQLIKGPISSNDLEPVIVPDVEVLNILKTDELLSVYLNNKIFGIDQKASEEALQSVILSLVESTDIDKVQIMVDQNIQVFSTNNINYSLPAVRPAHVNQIKM